MLYIKTNTPVEAYTESLKALLLSQNTTLDGLWKNSCTSIEIENPSSTDYYTKAFPMSKEKTDAYKDFFCSGKSVDLIEKEHAIYRERLINFQGIDQLEYIIETLKAKPTKKRAIALGIDPQIDYQFNGVCSCLVSIRCIIDNGKLEFHTHSRAGDAYKNLLMDLNLGIGMMQYIASKLSVPMGKYLHFFDTLHIYEADKESVNKLTFDQ